MARGQATNQLSNTLLQLNWGALGCTSAAPFWNTVTLSCSAGGTVSATPTFTTANTTGGYQLNGIPITPASLSGGFSGSDGIGILLYTGTLTAGNCFIVSTGLSAQSMPCPGGSLPTGTPGQSLFYNNSSVLLASSDWTDTTNFLVAAKGATFSDSTGNGGLYGFSEGTYPSGINAPVSNYSYFYGDATYQGIRAILHGGSANGGTDVYVPTVATPAVAKSAPQFDSTGVKLVQAPGYGTPTLTPDSGLGSGVTPTLGTGARDFSGTIAFTPAATPATNSGLITINFNGGTPLAAPPSSCWVEPGNQAMNAISPGAFVNGSFGTIGTNITSSGFVIRIGSAPVVAGTAYIVIYGCNP